MRFFKRMIWITVVAFFVSCSVQDSDVGLFDVNANEAQFQYYETQCADPWYGLDESTGIAEDEKIGIMVSFLESKGVEVLAASYSFDEDAALACLACTCQTGGVFMIKVKNEPEKIEQLYDLGFILL